MNTKKSNYFNTVTLPVLALIAFVFLCSLVISVPIALIEEHDAKQDQVITKNCEEVSLGDVVLIDNIPVYIGTAYLTGYRSVGGKGLEQEYQYSVTSFFVDQTPVLDFHGYRLITNSRDVQYVCSPEAIEEIY